MRVQMLKKYSQQIGRSMMEMLGVFGIIGVLSIGGIKGYSSAMHRYNRNKTIDWITEAANNYYSFIAEHGFDPNLFTKDSNNVKLIQDYFAPKDWQKKQTSPMGTRMIFFVEPGTNLFAVRIYDLEPSDCAYLVSFSATHYPLKSLWVNPLNKSFDDAPCTNEDGNQCITAVSQLNTPAKAAAACKGELNSILLIFKKH